MAWSKETTMTIRVHFPGGKRVDAEVGTHVIHTDQSPEHGGAGTAPEPFELFLSSLATCAGLYVLAFCQARLIPTEGIELVQRHRFDAAGQRLEAIELDIVLPNAFPEKYRKAVVHAAAACKVKKAMLAAPAFVVSARSASGGVLAFNATAV
jgi:putative redox protein